MTELPNKIDRLYQLGQMGLLIPDTLTASGSNVYDALDETKLYYCRALRRGEKITLIGTGSEIKPALIDPINISTTWAVQEVLDLAISGAAVLTSCDYVIEVVRGNPVALLRRGRIALRAAKSSRHHHLRFTRYLQDLRAAMAPAGLGYTPVRVGKESFDDLEEAARLVVAQLKNLPATGIVEWGIFLNDEAPKLYGLDYKQLSEQVAKELCEMAAGSTDPHMIADYEYPDMELVNVDSGQRHLTFNTGARLSHLVTYALPLRPYKFRS